MVRIQIDKVDKEKEGKLKNTTDKKSKTEEMSEKISRICDSLFEDSSKFEEEKVFESICDYIENYQRILYSEISSKIYACYETHDAEKAAIILGSMTSNIEKIVVYNSSIEYKNKKDNEYDGKKKKAYEDGEKAIIKILDHVNLASTQYGGLKQTDEEYKERFQKSITPFQEELIKEMNAQLLTMVSIFTALAFLVFGGISSLGSIFSNNEIPVLKVIIIGSVWGLGILNMVFIFLFCVGKMTGLDFKSTERTDANIFEKYPIVWWSDLIIVTIMAMGLWAYYVRKENIDSWFKNLCSKYPEIAMCGGFFVIAFLFIICFRKLLNNSSKKKSKK